MRGRAVVVVGMVAAALPLVGLVSLLRRSQLDPPLENHRLHFVVFGVVGLVAFLLGYVAGEAPNRRSGNPNIRFRDRFCGAGSRSEPLTDFRICKEPKRLSRQVMYP